jgi:transposase, IS30 family
MSGEDVDECVGLAWLREAGGVHPRRGRDLKGRCLSFSEREEIAVGRAGGETIRAIAARLGRSPSAISRELTRNVGCAGRYRARTAHALAYERPSRPKSAKLAVNLVLRAKVAQDLQKRYSPEQIAGRLRREFSDDTEMWVSTETIYQSLTCNRAARGVVTSRVACVPAGRCAGRAGSPGSARTASGHDQHQPASRRGR